MLLEEIAPGTTVGPSSWITIDQHRIDAFADATDDHQWIHVDPVRASDGPFGSTIAHGWLTLSLMAPFSFELLPIEGATTVNYGTNRVRFTAPVTVGSRLRAMFEVLDVTDIEGGVQLTVAATVEREGHDKPACIAELVYRAFR